MNNMASPNLFPLARIYNEILSLKSWEFAVECEKSTRIWSIHHHFYGSIVILRFKNFIAAHCSLSRKSLEVPRAVWSVSSNLAGSERAPSAADFNREHSGGDGRVRESSCRRVTRGVHAQSHGVECLREPTVLTSRKFKMSGNVLCDEPLVCSRTKWLACCGARLLNSGLS